MLAASIVVRSESGARAVAAPEQKKTALEGNENGNSASLPDLITIEAGNIWGKLFIFGFIIRF